MISGIYQQRTFSISDSGRTSADMVQGSGIAQGCPLSPYLFIMMLTVLFHEVDREVSGQQSASCQDLAYADDTALISADPMALQATMDALLGKAAQYGLTPNWDKTVHMPIRHNLDLHKPDGTPLKKVQQTTYLGAVLDASGRGNNVSRRIGEAKAIFETLNVVWQHANITRARKTQIFNAIVVPKAMYGLEPFLLNQAERARLDAFQAMALRGIFRIPHSMLSHISNVEVRRIAQQNPLSQRLLCHQLTSGVSLLCPCPIHPHPSRRRQSPDLLRTRAQRS